MTIPFATNDALFWAVVPAAGLGLRMGADRPKQYLTIGDKTVLEHTLAKLLRLSYLERIVVVIDKEDTFWCRTLYAEHPKIQAVIGGSERADSVLNGLVALQAQAKANDWILVHDAARPCLRQADMDRLVVTLKNHPTGGLLGCRTRDTMKLVNQQRETIQTLERNHIWHALTPQMFRFQLLFQALQQALQSASVITDEASAIELLGYQPFMVEGCWDNIKVTNPEDLKLAEYYLSQYL